MRAIATLRSLLRPVSPATRLLSAAVWLPASAAAVDLADMGLEELMNVEVTLVSRRPQRLSETAAAAAVLTADAIGRSGVRSIPEALRLIPGVQVGRIDANKWIVTSRGFAGLFSNKLLVLIDGRSVYTPLFSGVFWESQDLVMEDIERIEVIRGPGGSLWGANAVNGIINIVTRHAAETHGRLIEVGAGGDHDIANVRHGGSFGGDRGHYRVYGKGVRYHRSEPAGELPIRDAWHMGRAGFRVDYSPSRRDDVLLSGGFNDGAVGQSLTYTASVPPPLKETFYQDADVRGAHLLGRWTRRFDSGSVELQSYYDHFFRAENVLRGSIDNADVDMQHRLRRGRHDVVWGLGYRRTSDDFAGGFAMWLEPERRTTHLFSGFAHDEMRFWSDAVKLSVGSKFEHNSYSQFEWQPNARLWWSPAPGQALWGSLSRAVRTPSRSDHDLNAVSDALPPDSLFQDAPVALVTLIGDDMLTAEQLLAAETGYRASFSERASVDLAAFYNRYDDLLTLEPGLPYAVGDPEAVYLLVPLRLRNRARATTFGLEGAIAWDVSDDGRLRFLYSFLDLDVELADGSRDVSTVDVPGESPRHQLGMSLHADLSRRVQLYVAGRYVGRIENSGIDAYPALDTRLAWRGAGVEVGLSAVNLLQKEHREAVSRVVGAVETAVPRALQGSLRWNF